MERWKLHTPEGVQDILEKDCNFKRQIEEQVGNVFQSYGYYEIQPPSFEFYDVFASESGLIKQETMFKFFDHQGRILVLRPDITTPIARILATKYQELSVPKRLCYIGNAFRYDEPYQGAKLREFTQAGLELIGVNTPEADAEVIAVTIHALLSTGLTDFQIEIGQISFFKGLMNQTGLDESDVEQMRLLIDHKDSLGIEELVQSYALEDQLKEVILSLPSLFGGIEVIDKIEKITINEQSLDALNNLRRVYEILVDYGLEKYISIDLGMVQSMHYYTGVIFKGFTHGLGFPICSGGRYDCLIKEFGKDLSAMGVAIGINRLMSALDRQQFDFALWKVDSVIYYMEAGRKRAFEIADALRKQGLIIQMYLGNAAYEQIVEYAKEKEIDGIITVFDKENIELNNLLTGEKVKTTFKQLISDRQSE